MLEMSGLYGKLGSLLALVGPGPIAINGPRTTLPTRKFPRIVGTAEQRRTSHGQAYRRDRTQGRRIAGDALGGIPLHSWVVIAAVLAVPVGLVWGEGATRLGVLPAMIIRAATALAAPIVFLAILNAIVTNEIRGPQVARMMAYYLINTTAKNGARIVVDKRSLWQRKALNGSRLRLLIWGVLAAFLVVVSIPWPGSYSDC